MYSIVLVRSYNNVLRTVYLVNLAIVWELVIVYFSVGYSSAFIVCLL